MKKTIVLMSIQLFILAVLIYIYATNIHKFLIRNRPIETKLLVVEGWIPDYALDAALKEFETNKYDYLITTGMRLQSLEATPQYDTEAQRAMFILKEKGMKRDKIRAVSSKYVLSDKSYNSAKTLHLWMLNHIPEQKSFNIFTCGPHSRRSLASFEKAFGKDYNIGIITALKPGYEPEHWYKTFDGFKSMLEETAAWVYVRLFFYPKFL